MTVEMMRARSAEWRRRARLAETDEARVKMNLLATHYDALADRMERSAGGGGIGKEGS